MLFAAFLKLCRVIDPRTVQGFCSLIHSHHAQVQRFDSSHLLDRSPNGVLNSISIERIDEEP